MKRRWRVVARDVNGDEVGEYSRHLLRTTADHNAERHRADAVHSVIWIGEHRFGALYTVHVERV